MLQSPPTSTSYVHLPEIKSHFTLVYGGYMGITYTIPMVHKPTFITKSFFCCDQHVESVPFVSLWSLHHLFSGRKVVLQGSAPQLETLLQISPITIVYR